MFNILEIPIVGLIIPPSREETQCLTPHQAESRKTKLAESRKTSWVKKNETWRAVKNENWRCCTSPKVNHSIVSYTNANTKFHWQDHKSIRWPWMIVTTVVELCQAPSRYPKSVSNVMRNTLRSVHCNSLPNRRHRNTVSDRHNMRTSYT